MKDHFERLVDHFVGNGFSMDEAVALLERALIARALEKTRGNRSAASKMLKVHRNTLQRKIAEYGLEVRAPERKLPSSIRAISRRAAGEC
jgi:DNA-binding NtrC family response regulator